MIDDDALPELIPTTAQARLRAATVEDCLRLTALYAQLHADGALDLDAIAAELSRIQEAPNRRVYVYEVDGETVGTIDVFLMRNLTRGRRPWAGVENFVVDEAHRQRGHGRAMLEAVVAIIRQIGAYKVQLISSDRRSDAHSLYTAVGFVAPVTGFRMYLTDVGH